MQFNPFFLHSRIIIMHFGSLVYLSFYFGSLMMPDVDLQKKIHSREIVMQNVPLAFSSDTNSRQHYLENWKFGRNSPIKSILAQEV